MERAAQQQEQQKKRNNYPHFSPSFFKFLYSKSEAFFPRFVEVGTTAAKRNLFIYYNI
jgi:hypothetical protein